ncbi:MAG: RNA polymerase sigma factor RpoD/SigA [Sumerlaeia bacterium]
MAAPSTLSHYEDGLQDYLKVASQHAVLTREQEIELFQRIEQGEEAAREKMIESNLRFVIKIAYTYRNQGLSISDLIQEGNIGLLHVISKFDWRKGFRFSTYAAFYIRQEIQSALHRSGTMIRVPVRKSRLLSKVNEFVHRYQENYGFEPCTDEIAVELGVSREKVEAVLELRHSFASLDAEFAQDGNTLSDLLEDKHAPSPDLQVSKQQSEAAVHDAMSILTEREREVIELRFGMSSHDEEMSLRQASKYVGLSQEGVRRVEQRALDKLRRPTICEPLMNLLSA